ncbi:MAG: hypothetical protein ACFN4D_08195, partial [Cardiobacterium sp.]
MSALFENFIMPLFQRIVSKTMSDPLPFKGRSVSVTAVLLQDADTAQIDVALSEKIAQVPPDFFTTQPLVADFSALEGFKPDTK